MHSMMEGKGNGHQNSNEDVVEREDF